MQDGSNLLFSIVVSDDPMALRKDQAVGLLRLRIILEDEVHTYSLQLFVALDLNGFLTQLELFLFALSVTTSRLAPLENEYLIRRLLVFDQVSSSDDGQVFVVWTDLHGNDFVGFPRITLEQIELKSIFFNLLECLSIIHFYLFRVGDEENFHRLDVEAQ